MIEAIRVPMGFEWLFGCFFSFKSIVGVGVGAGAYILAKFAVSESLLRLWMYC